EVMSVFSPSEVYMLIIETVMTRMPRMRNYTYSPTELASAPPKRNVNISVIMIGNMVASNNWKGTCLIFSSARHAKVMDAAKALGREGRLWVVSAACSLVPLTGFDRLGCIVVIVQSPRLLRRRRVVRSMRGILRLGWAPQVRNR